MKALSFLKDIQKQSIDMIEHEQYGLNNIAKVSDTAREACNFQTLLVIQTAGEEMQTESSFGTWRMDNGQEAFSTYGLTLNCFDHGSGSYCFKATFNSGVVEAWKMENVLNQLCHVMAELTSASDAATLADIQDLTVREKEVLAKWNAASPKAADLHWIVDEGDVNRIKPIGAPGALLIEGSSTGVRRTHALRSDGVEYENVPVWRTWFNIPVSKFILTRRLATYNQDGSITLIESSVAETDRKQ